MKFVINNEKTKNKDLLVDINDWTGTIKVSYDGRMLPKVKRRVYQLQDGEKTGLVTIKGNYFTGLQICIADIQVEVLCKLAWYEILMASLVLASAFVFSFLAGKYGRSAGYSVLVSSLIAGLCGGIGGALMSLDRIFLFKYEKLYIKIIISCLLLLISILSNYILVFLIFRV